MKTIILDGIKQKKPADIYDYFAKEFDFGPYFGKNPSALYDFMIPIDEEDRPLIIEWHNSHLFKENHPIDFENLIKIFNQIDKFEKHNKNIFQFKIMS